MLFSSVSFLYYFLPITLGLYFIVPQRFRNFVLFLASMIFYFWGEPIYSVLMLFSSFMGYIHGILIEKNKGTKYAKVFLVSSAVVSLGFLAFFKYVDFFIDNINALLGTDISGVLGAKVGFLTIIMPIGISFYTFQILSYTIDVYRGEAKCQKNFISFATYVSLFPQLIAGPIVRYADVQDELDCRTHSFENFAVGARRFIFGLSKKIFIADVFAALANTFYNTDEKTVLMYWIIAVAYTLQIYFDFSGYSDMAIGLGRIFGFHFLENFNYPYISRSITEFWRRWHMSLGTWFRDYVYIPLGGNRVKKWRWFLNIFIVWFLTGFWHGAAWNYIVWGLYFGIILMLEKLFLLKWLEYAPRFISHVYTMALVVFGFVIFNEDVNWIEAIRGMFGALDIPFSNAVTVYQLRNYAFVLLIGVIGATPLLRTIVTKLQKNEKATRVLNVFEPIVIIVLLLMVTGYLVDGSFSPFIYFRF